MINIVDPPQPRVVHLVMVPALQQALSVIQKGAEERLEVLKTKKSQLERGKSSGDMVPKLIGHIKKWNKRMMTVTNLQVVQKRT